MNPGSKVEVLHCDLCLSPIAEGRTTSRLFHGQEKAFCCPGCATVYGILGPEEAQRQGPRFKGSVDEGQLPPGPYLEAWFRVEGANLNILKETDDGTTDTDDTDTTIDIVDNTWTRLRIDMTTLAAVAFSVDGVAAGGAAMSIPLASGNLQPFIEQQKDAGAEVETLDIDYVLISWAR